jgi:2'-5' RNA ligase
MTEPDFSGLVIALPELDPLLQPWRSRFHNDIKDLPAHVTLLAPWIAPADITDDDLRLVSELAGQWSRFEVSFSDLRTFEAAAPGAAAVHWLAPEPDEPFRQLIDDLMTTWPEYPPYGGAYGNDPTPHLTVANAAMTGDELTAMREHIGPALPVRTVAEQLLVLQVVSGRCERRGAFRLGAGRR